MIELRWENIAIWKATPGQNARSQRYDILPALTLFGDEETAPKIADESAVLSGVCLHTQDGMI